MSKNEIYAMMAKNPDFNRAQAIENTDMPSNVVSKLAGKGINTVGALMETDAFDTVTSGRYDLSNIREVNGIPVAAFRWLLDAVAAEAVPAV